MSVMIKGMEMPKTCAECPLLYDGDACYAMNKRNGRWLPLVINSSSTEYKINQFPYKEKRVDWCPLVEVKTPHGRLIDADAEKAQIDNMIVYGDVFTTAKNFASIVLEKAPTVIEAEDE